MLPGVRHRQEQGRFGFNRPAALARSLAEASILLYLGV
jgi:hypothetical protein